MKILITNWALDRRAGSELFVKDLAVKLLSLGHEPYVYSPILGGVAKEIAEAGVPVFSDLNAIKVVPDVIHGQHCIHAINALIRFPDVPAIYVCHERLSPQGVPPIHKQIARYVAVDKNCSERLTLSGVPDEKIEIIANSVDMDRFKQRANVLPVKPKKALIFSSFKKSKIVLGKIKNACRKINVQLDVIGDVPGAANQPEKFLSDYELVFAKGRCAIEALVSGASVIVCDYFGIGPIVSIKNVRQLRDWNFGMRCLTYPVTEENLIREIEKYDAKDAKQVSEYMTNNATLDQMTNKYLSLYNKVVADTKRAKLDAAEALGEFIKDIQTRDPSRIAHVLLGMLGMLGYFSSKYPHEDVLIGFAPLLRDSRLHETAANLMLSLCAIERKERFLLKKANKLCF